MGTVQALIAIRLSATAEISRWSGVEAGGQPVHEPACFAERNYTLDFAPDGLLYDVVYSSYSAERVSARQMQGLSSSARDRT